MGHFEEDIGYALIHLVKKHRILAEEALSSIGLHIAQDLILFLLREEDGLSQSQLASRLKLELPTVTKSIQRMEQGGIVVRSRDEQDSRISRVYLTEEGQKLYEPANRQWNSLEQRMLADFSIEERETFHRLIRKASSNLEQASGARSDKL
ncbi:MarR family winged helix-turn-helix transcriptional regulator [Paenibacillus glufosinatiresistens]|uniref:MarR family winged helix-turn-helix transcriptional regulator n=1 Tax=Paenibacillus glufosinatiresistens TaxID=3070657 RepID=UPI00286D9C00|nr:MarR family transcriptional regulator [Paenibacillus sp. YX.27]